jgi:hypothetical protein
MIIMVDSEAIRPVSGLASPGRAAGDRHRLASSRLPVVLDVEEPSPNRTRLRSPIAWLALLYVRDSGRAVQRFEKTDGVISAVRHQGACLHLATISVTSSRCS